MIHEVCVWYHFVGHFSCPAKKTWVLPISFTLSNIRRERAPNSIFFQAASFFVKLRILAKYPKRTTFGKGFSDWGHFATDWSTLRHRYIIILLSEKAGFRILASIWQQCYSVPNYYPLKWKQNNLFCLKFSIYTKIESI